MNDRRWLTPLMLILSCAATGYAFDDDERAPRESPSDRVEARRPYETDVADEDAGDDRRSRNTADSDETIPPPPADSDSNNEPDFELSPLDEDVDGEKKPAKLPPVDETDGLDVDELVAIALSQHPTMQQARVAVDKARGLQFQSGRKFNPTVGYMASEVGNDGRLGQQGIFVEQTFVRGNKLQLNTHVYGAEVDRVSLGVKLQSLKIARQVRERYFELVYARRRAEVLKRLLKVSKKNVSIANARYEADEVSQSQVFQANLEAQQLQLSLKQSVTQSETAARRLTNIMAVPDYDVSGHVRPPQNPPLELNRDALWEDLQTKSPELAIARASVRKAERAIQRARVEPVGNVETQFSLQFDDSSNFTVAGMQVGVPIAVHDHNLGNIQATEADYVRACSEVQRLKLALRERLTTAYSRYELAIQSRTAAANEMMPIARKNLELTTKRYDLGEVEFTDLLLAQRMYLGINLALVEADSELWKIVTGFEQLLVNTASKTINFEPNSTVKR